jgi:Family of unknown function (DUF6913)
MNILHKFRYWWHHYFLKKALKRHKVRHQSFDIKSAGMIGILFDGTEMNDREVVLDYAKNLKKEGKKVKLLAYLNTSQEQENFVFPHFDKKDLDWALRPQGQAVNSFLQQPFDILINLAKQQNIPLEYVAALSKAKFRVGPLTGESFCYELMIEATGAKDVKAFLSQVSFFLNKMKTTYEAAI